MDGTKLNLPRSLIRHGYKLPSKKACYPQGLLSCLYQVKSQIPVDFDLVSHHNERICAEQHLKVLEKDDVVIYDRGYFSYLMLLHHVESNIHAVFRLQESCCTVVEDFFKSTQTDIITTIYPSATVRRDIGKAHPEQIIAPLQLRLIKYQIGDNTYCLGTTLKDRTKYKTQDFIELYHSRWGVEELYKISKRLFLIEDFHAKTERGVKQEIFAHFALITMNRIFANQADIDLNLSNVSKDALEKTVNSAPPSSSSQLMCKIKTNFKNCVHVFSRSMEELLLLNTKLKSVIERAFLFIIGRHQKERSGRSFPRKSMRPVTKRSPSKEKNQSKLLLDPAQ